MSSSNMSRNRGSQSGRALQVMEATGCKDAGWLHVA
jgi:hypothetical protein